MKRSKTFAGYTVYYHYEYGTRQITLKRVKHGSDEAFSKHTMTFGTVAEAARYFDNECGA